MNSTVETRFAVSPKQLLKPALLAFGVALALNSFANSTQREQAPGWSIESASDQALRIGVQISPTEEAAKNKALLQEAMTRASEQNLRVVYLDPASPISQISKNLATSQALEANASRQIVIADSSNPGKSLITQLLATGNFVISVGDTKIDSTKSAFDMLMDVQYNGKLSKPIADYDADQPRFTVSTGDQYGVQNTTNGTLSAYFYSPRGSKSFHSAKQDVSEAMADALVWARETAIAEDLRAAEPITKALSFTEVLQRSYSVDCKHTYPNNTPTVGRLNVKTIYSKANSDGSSTRDYWEVRYIGQMLPSAVINNGSGWGWKNEDLWVSSKANKKAASGLLKDYGPTTSQGTNTTSVELSASTSGGGIARNWSYSIGDIVVKDTSDFSTQTTNWWHNINGSKAVGSSTIKLEPGALADLPQNTLAYNSMYEYFKAQWIVDNAWPGTDDVQWCAVSWN